MHKTYRGRLAPSPTGLLHAGHAATFLKAAELSANNSGQLIYRNDDLDADRCKPLFSQAAIEDLHWLGIRWHEGPDVGGSCAPYSQSQRHIFYLNAFEKLRASGAIYPCSCSRREVASALSAPHVLDEEPLYPGFCRPADPMVFEQNTRLNWRFRIPQPEKISFEDGRLGLQTAVAGEQFGDFLIWRKDGVPSYQLACAVDDALMRISEVVRGEDLVTSTFRQLLVLRALGYEAPAFHHCALLTDASGRRLAKRDAALSLQALRNEGYTPEDVRQLIQKTQKQPGPSLSE